MLAESCNCSGCIEWVRSPGTSATFWIPNHPELVSKFLVESFNQALRGGHEVADRFFRDVSSFFFHLPPESALYPVMFSHVLALFRVFAISLDGTTGSR
jgi:hypothetical protein